MLMGEAPGETGMEHATPDPTNVRAHVSLNQPVVPGVLGGVSISHPSKSAQ